MNAAPDADTLRKFALGDLPPQEWDRVARFLEANPQSPDTIAELGTEDTFLSALRAVPSGPADDPPEVRSIIAAAVKLLDGGTAALDPGTGSLPFLAASEAEIVLPPNGRLGRFRIVRELGRGGMGAVFAAVDEQLGRDVALKVMLPRLAANPVARERFLREARTAALVEHDNIVPILEVGEDAGIPFIAMPLLRGESLDDRLKAGAVPAAEAVRIAREMVEGLAAAHAHGLIHRDIKPSNVWLETNPDGRLRRVRILDFGLARLVTESDRVTLSGTILGTPAFMAPEQARGSVTIDARADLFSLGGVLYRMTTGRNPFHGTDTYSLLSALATDTPKAPTELNASVPRAMNDLILKLLQKDPAARPQSAADVLTALDAIPTATAAPAPRRSRALPITAVALSLIGLVGILFGGTIVRIATNKGELVVEVNDANVEVVVKQDGAVVVDKTKDRRFVLTAKDGEIEFLDPETGATAQTKTFRLTRGGVDRVTATMGEGMAKAEPAKPKLEADTDRIAALYAISIGGTISLDGGAERIADAAALPKSKFQLTAVFLANNKKVDDRAIAIIAGCAKLEVLDFALTGITDAGLFHLRSIKTLKAVLLYSTRVSDAGMKHLAGNLGLETLDVHGTPVTDTGLAQFKDCKNLHAVDLRSLRITNEGLRPFAGCKLRDLKLAETPITDDGLAILKDTDDLRNLDLTGTKITDRGLQYLAGNKRLATLGLSNTPITDEGLAQLALTELVDFSAQGTAISDRTLTALAKLPILRYIDVRRTKVTGAGILAFRAAKPNCTIVWDGGTIEPQPSAESDRAAALLVLAKGGKVRVNGEALAIADAKDLPSKAFQLTRVDLSYLANLNDADFKVFESCRHLRELDLRGTKPTPEWFAHFRNGPELEVLNLDYTGIGDAGLENFKICKKLRVLSLAETTVTAKGMAHFAGCTELRELRLQGDLIDDAAVAHFKDCRKIEKLMLNQAAITNAGLEIVQGNTGLTHLSLFKCNIDDTAFTKLQLKKLTEVVLSGTGIGDAGLAQFEGNAALWSVDLDGTKVTNAGLAKLKGMAERGRLTLGGTSVDDAGLAHLAGKDFSYLNLGRTRVTDAGLAHLASVKSLTVISITDTAITDAGLVHLKGSKSLQGIENFGCPGFTGSALKEFDLSELRDLRASRTGLTDDGLAHLAKCKKLNSVECEGSKVTRAGIEKLQEAQPKCRIVWTGGTIEPK